MFTHLPVSLPTSLCILLFPSSWSVLFNNHWKSVSLSQTLWCLCFTLTVEQSFNQIQNFVMVISCPSTFLKGQKMDVGGITVPDLNRLPTRIQKRELNHSWCPNVKSLEGPQKIHRPPSAHPQHSSTYPACRPVCLPPHCTLRPCHTASPLSFASQSLFYLLVPTCKIQTEPCFVMGQLEITLHM